MEIVVGASLVTAFLAGTAALLAPCCIGVLLPSYLATVFKTRTKIFLMTFVYYLGLLTIFLPLGLGMAALGSVFARYHGAFFTIGGLFMLALGISMILGKSVMLPIHVKQELKKYDFGSVYVLGLFSGIATSCCAPVLAGVLALSGLAGSFFLGSLYALTFVTGMVIPLFIMAIVIDKTKVTERLRSWRRKVSYSIFGRRIVVNLSHLIAGVLYLLVGGFILFYERTNAEVYTGSYQIQINLLAAQITRWFSRNTAFMPEAGWVVIFLLLIGLIVWSAYRQVKSIVPKQPRGEL